MYLKNSHNSRDLPLPASPVTVTRRAVLFSTVSSATAMIVSSSRSRPTNGASSPTPRRAPPTPATTRSARQAWTGCSRPLTSCVPASSYSIAASLARRVTSSTSAVPGAASDCSRDAVLTVSPSTIPSPSAPSSTAAFPVSTPARTRSSGIPTSSPSAVTAWVSASAARTARSASSSRAIGVPQTAITASPMNFSTVPP